MTKPIPTCEKKYGECVGRQSVNHQSEKRQRKKSFKKLSAALGELPPPLLLQNCSMDFNSGSLECDVSHICFWKY